MLQVDDQPPIFRTHLRVTSMTLCQTLRNASLKLILQILLLIIVIGVFRLTSSYTEYDI